LKTPNTKRVGGASQVVKRLPSKCDALNLNPSATKKKKKKKTKKIYCPKATIVLLSVISRIDQTLGHFPRPVTSPEPQP
jgi:hypothetical protein